MTGAPTTEHGASLARAHLVGVVVGAVGVSGIVRLVLGAVAGGGS